MIVNYNDHVIHLSANKRGFSRSYFVWHEGKKHRFRYNVLNDVSKGNALRRAKKFINTIT